MTTSLLFIKRKDPDYLGDLFLIASNCLLFEEILSKLKSFSKLIILYYAG